MLALPRLEIKRTILAAKVPRGLWGALESKNVPSPRTKYAHTHSLRGRNRRAKFVLGSLSTLKKLRF